MRIVKNNNFVPQQQLSRESMSSLAAVIDKYKFTAGAEIGVLDGAFSYNLMQIYDDLSMILVDPWSAELNDMSFCDGLAVTRYSQFTPGNRVGTQKPHDEEERSPTQDIHPI